MMTHCHCHLHVPTAPRPASQEKVNRILENIGYVGENCLEFALTVAGSIENDTELGDDLKGLATGVETILGALMDPVGSVLKDLCCEKVG